MQIRYIPRQKQPNKVLYRIFRVNSVINPAVSVEICEIRGKDTYTEMSFILRRKENRLSFTFSKLIECMVVTVKLYKSSLNIQPNDLISIEAILIFNISQLITKSLPSFGHQTVLTKGGFEVPIAAALLTKLLAGAVEFLV